MGTAVTSVADDAYAIFYNPAGLAGIRNLETSAGIGRRWSELGACGEVSAVYARPVPDRRSGTVGIGYYSFSQSGVGSKYVLAAGWGETVIIKSIQKPLAWGANLKMINLRHSGKERFGVGVDAGVMMETAKDIKTGLAVTDLDTGVGVSLKSLSLGNSYRWKDTLFALDLRLWRGIAELLPGLEHTLFNGLAKVRAGKGLALNGTSQLALGLGCNLYPFSIDSAMSFPWQGFHLQEGFYQFSVGYRFGVPRFTETFIGQAAEKAETLKREIGVLEARKTELDKTVAAAQVNKSIFESDVRTIQLRSEDLKARLKNLELDILEAQRYREKPPPKKIQPRPVKEKWPRRHTVSQGDTLRSIASKYYGDSSRWERIFEANSDKISRGLPEPGSVLEIPAPPSKKP
ncbi:MAG: LysM peptidoglycan-binding domain-containing protein [bacterium]